MGSSLSNSLANIFVNILEKSVIPKLIKSKKILHWSRYVDDIICITEKNSTTDIFEKLNSFDHRLKFTIEKMNNNELKFLDSIIFIKNAKKNLKKIQKRP